MSDSATATHLLAEARSLDADGKHQAALGCVLRAIAIFRQAVAAEENTAKALCTAAQIASSLKRDDDAVAFHCEAITIFRKLYGDHGHSLLSRAMRQQCNLLHRLGREPELARALDRDGRAVQQRLEDAMRGDDQALFYEAEALLDAGNYSDAIPVFERALETHRRLLGARPDDAISVGILHGTAFAHKHLGQHEDALAIQTEEVQIARCVFDDADHEKLALALGFRGTTLVCLDCFDDALMMHTEALAMHRRLADGADREIVALALHSVATMLLSLSRYEEALPLFEEALTMLHRLSDGRDSASLLHAMVNLCAALQRVGRDPERQRSLLEDSHSMQVRLAGDKEGEDLAISMYNAGVAKNRDGDVDGAMQLFTEAYAMLMRLFPDGHRAAATAQCMRGRVLLRDEDTRDEGEQEIEHGLTMMCRMTDGSLLHAEQLRECGRALVAADRSEKGNQLLKEADEMSKRIAAVADIATANAAFASSAPPARVIDMSDISRSSHPPPARSETQPTSTVSSSVADLAQHRQQSLLGFASEVVRSISGVDSASAAADGDDDDDDDAAAEPQDDKQLLDALQKRFPSVPKERLLSIMDAAVQSFSTMQSSASAQSPSSAAPSSSAPGAAAASSVNSVRAALGHDTYQVLAAQPQVGSKLLVNVCLGVDNGLRAAFFFENVGDFSFISAAHRFFFPGADPTFAAAADGVDGLRKRRVWCASMSGGAGKTRGVLLGVAARCAPRIVTLSDRDHYLPPKCYNDERGAVSEATAVEMSEKTSMYQAQLRTGHAIESYFQRVDWAFLVLLRIVASRDYARDKRAALSGLTGAVHKIFSLLSEKLVFDRSMSLGATKDSPLPPVLYHAADRSTADSAAVAEIKTQLKDVEILRDVVTHKLGNSTVDVSRRQRLAHVVCDAYFSAQFRSSPSDQRHFWKHVVACDHAQCGCCGPLPLRSNKTECALCGHAIDAHSLILPSKFESELSCAAVAPPAAAAAALKSHAASAAVCHKLGDDDSDPNTFAGAVTALCGVAMLVNAHDADKTAQYRGVTEKQLSAALGDARSFKDQMDDAHNSEMPTPGLNWLRERRRNELAAVCENIYAVIRKDSSAAAAASGAAPAATAAE